jgi:hypothetical protein
VLFPADLQRCSDSLRLHRRTLVECRPSPDRQRKRLLPEVHHNHRHDKSNVLSLLEG